MRHSVLLLMLIASLAVNAYPLAVTQQPYNVDSILEYRAAEWVAEHGNLNYPDGVAYNNNHTPATPLLNALTGAISSASGVDARTSLIALTLLVSSTACLGVYALALRWTRRESIALLAGTLVVVSGLSVYASSSIWKQGFSIPIMLASLYLYTHPRGKPISVAMFFLLLITHHFTAFICALTVTYISLNRALSTFPEDGWRSVRHIALPLALWSAIYAYYTSVNFDRTELLPIYGEMLLFLAVLVPLTIICYWLNRWTWDRGGSVKLAAAFTAVPLAIYAYGFVSPLFRDTLGFNEMVLAFTLGYVLALPFLVRGGQLLLHTVFPAKDLFVGYVLSVMHMYLFAFLRARDFVSHHIASRTTVLLAPLVSLLIALGAFSSKGSRFRVYGAVAMAVVVISTTTPIAYVGWSAFGADMYVHGWEMNAASYLSGVNSTVYTDDKLGRVAHNAYDVPVSASAPLLMEENSAIDGYVLCSERWQTEGAQMYPMPPVKVNITSYMDDADILLISGPPGERVYVLRLYG